jgi:type II secretory pathway component GspD/PulD (secretin)
MKFLIVLSILLTTQLTFAKTKTCKNLDTCIELVSKLTKKKYIIDKDVKGAIKVSSNFKLNKENADDFLSEVLSINGYTRVPSKKDQWTIINTRDVRYMPTKNYIYGKDKIPTNFDYIMVTVKLKNPHIASEVSRNFRPFMSRYGRIIDIKNPGIIIINDTGKNVHRLLSLIEILDKKPSKEELEAYNDQAELKNKIRVIKAKNCSDIKVELHEIRALLQK